MRKSNVIIIAILMISSIFFLWLWNYLHFHLIDMRDLIITILWWLITIGLCIGIHYAEKKRRERIRTIFIADGLLYNAEAGIIRAEDNTPESYVNAMHELLCNLEYEPRVKADGRDKDTNQRLRFKYIVHSPKFSENKDVWEGEVLQVRGARDAFEFNDQDELLRIFAAQKI